jgi:hypothetical protein
MYPLGANFHTLLALAVLRVLDGGDAGYMIAGGIHPLMITLPELPIANCQLKFLKCVRDFPP